MLERAFTLNFNFFDNTNGAGTRHLLKLAKMEHARRTGASRDSSTHRCVASVLLMCCYLSRCVANALLTSRDASTHRCVANVLLMCC
jgi:hypothetical protein